MGSTTGQTSVLDTITRTAYNNSNDVLAVQYITVMVHHVHTTDAAGRSLQTSESQSTARFKRTAVLKVKTEFSHNSNGSGVVRTINRITTTGKFDSHATDGNGDVESVTYLGTNGVNDLIIPVNTLEGVLKEGDQS